MSLFSIFTNRKPVTFEGLSNDSQDASYHFDAIGKYSLDLTATYTSYPIEFGADLQDSAYNNPNKMVIYGYTASRELSISINQLPELGISAAVGRINDSRLSVVSGIAGAAASYLAGSESTRGGATLQFLIKLKEKFETFTVQTGLIRLPDMKIDVIHTDVDPDNETGLEFICELSQSRIAGRTKVARSSTSNLLDSDPAKTQGSTLLDRGRVAFA